MLIITTCSFSFFLRKEEELNKKWFFAQFTDKGGRLKPPLKPEEDIALFLTEHGLHKNEVLLLTWVDMETGWQWFTLFYQAESALPVGHYSSALYMKR